MRKYGFFSISLQNIAKYMYFFKYMRYEANFNSVNDKKRKNYKEDLGV